MTNLNSRFNVSHPSVTTDGCPPEVSQTKLQWFVMRVTYCRELKIQDELKDAGVETYVPLRKERSEDGIKVVAAVHNFIFVHTTRDFMDSYKQKKEYSSLRYYMDSSTGLPMVVREKDMDNFMHAMQLSSLEDIQYLDNPDVVVQKGTPIVVTLGPYKGIEGSLLRIRGDRKVVIQLADIVAATLNGIPREWVKIKEKQ